MELSVLAMVWTMYFVLHSVLATDVVKDYFSRLLKGAFAYYRLVYNVISIIGLLFCYWLYQNTLVMETFWDVGDYLQWGSWLISGLGIIVIFLSFKGYSMGEFSGISQSKKIDDKSSLNQSGLNSLVRHPIYFGSLLLFWGNWVGNASLKWLVIACVCSIYLVVGAKLEELKLIRVFGDEYRNYKSKVRMLIPFIF